MDVLKATLDALKKSTKDLTLFGPNSYKDKKGNFLIVPCDIDESGELITVFVGFVFEGGQTADDYLFFEWHSQDLKLWVGKQTCTLNESLYAQVRNEVSKKLGVNGVRYIDKLKLPADLMPDPPAGH